MKIIEVKENKKQYLDLLLLADEQEDMVDRYLDNGKMYVLDDNGVKCECVITDKENDILEIKNIATVPEYQGKGYARALIEFIVNNYREQYAILQVGTGDSPLTIPFYEKCGFVRSHIISNLIKTPKTKSGIRQVPLSRETIQAFQRVMKKRPKTEPFVIDGRSNFLFVNHKGKPKVAIDYNALFVRMVKKYNKQHKDNPLPHITPHTLRHTFCTRLASKNMNPKDLQYIMGHSNISITMNWYAHASIDTAKSEVQRLIA